MMVLAAALAVLLILHLVAAVIATRLIARAVAAAHPPDGRFVPVSGGRLHVHDMGGRCQRPAVLLLHGATSNARDLRLALGGDLARRHRVIIPDRPGHGWSERPGGRADASPARQAALIVEALDRLGVERVVAVGYSWSGALAARLALDHGDRVAGLVLLAGATHPWPGGVKWYYRLAAMPVLGRIFVHTVMAPVAAFGFRRILRETFGAAPMPADYAEATAAALVLRPAEFRCNGEDVALLHAAVAEQASRYRAIAVPTAVVTGDLDTVVSPVIHSQAMAREIVGARHVVLAGVGHMLHHAAKDAVLAEIERVVARASPAPAEAGPDRPLRLL